MGVACRSSSDIRSVSVILRNYTNTVASRQVILLHLLHCDERFSVQGGGFEVNSSQIVPMFPFLSAFNNVQSKLRGPESKL